uniref:VWFA domain-containing protein n=1 Tax=Esox lucius TaxID=8010 RepID=A0A6Q2YM12_ESOLU
MGLGPRAGSGGVKNRMGQRRTPAQLRPGLWILCFGWFCSTAYAQMKIPPETVQVWANKLSVQLREVSTTYSGAHILQKKLKDVESSIKIVEIDGREQLRDYADDIERMLGSKMKSVKRLAESAEDADLYHDFNKSLQFDYYNSMLVNTIDDDGNFVELGGEFPLEENEHFNNLPVNTIQSDVQVPTNVYNKDPNILNGIYMSEALNDVFINNFQKDPTLTWQYFGSSTGFFRIYPGIKWTPDSNGVAAFDCRNRNWYIQAATSPKDIIIVVDISGSMKGLKMTIAKHTINTILDTLGENDFVNVIAYTDYVRYVEPCFKGTLVQADLDNREHFKVLVDELHVKGEGKVAKAMKESFKILNEGSLCNQAIMLITDGAMEDFKDVFEEFNWPDRRVRLFTYLIGREMTFAENTKWIACNNKGYYTHISTLADVQENVMEYLHVLSRPMVINHNHDIIWTEAYMDTVAQSLLLMTSVAMPVFSKKKETLSHGILLGVVGSDIPLQEVMKMAPRYRLGPHGYAFLITNNGYILAHPDLRPLYKDGKQLKPKPNYNSVDLSEVEWEDIDETLRTAMVKGETGALTLDVRASVDKSKRPLFLTNDYYYTTINDTPFSFGMVLTRGHGQLMFIGKVSVEEGLHDLTSPDLSIASEWTYCETDIDPHHRKYTQLQAMIRYLQGKEPDLECDEVLLRQTLFDAVLTAPLEAYWQAVMLNASGVEEGVETAFLGTRSGILRLTSLIFRLHRKFLTLADKENLFTVDHFPLWYRMAAENPPGRFLYYMPVEEQGVKDKTGTVPITRVIGQCGFLTIVCLSNRVDLYDYQGMCRTGHSHSSGARPLLSVSQSLQWCFSIIGNKMFRFFETMSLMWTLSLLAHKAKKSEALQPCDTEYPGFMLDFSIRETNSLIKCGRCQKMFVVQAIPESNLVLMVVQADCDCSRQYPAIPLEPKEIKYNASVKCNRMKSQKVRRRPKSCHAYHPKENAKDCGGASEISLSLALFLASLFTSLALRRWT